METDYPWDGKVVLTVEEAPAEKWSLSLRIPAWSPEAEVLINGKQAEAESRPGTYVRLDRTWRQGGRIELVLGLRARLTAPNPWIESARGNVAIERGPLVYCIEQADQGSHRVPDLEIDTKGALKSIWRPDVLGGVMQVEAEGLAPDTTQWRCEAYRPLDEVREESPIPVALVAIPYFAWANRGPGAMRVWIPRGVNQ
jgi:DUF1680 family protein